MTRVLILAAALALCAAPALAGQPVTLKSEILDADGMVTLGDLFDGAGTTGTPGNDGIGTLSQGYTEASNVDAVSEITALIVAQRAYEMNSKVITSADEMLRTASNIRS